MARFWKVERSGWKVAHAIAAGKLRTIDLGRLHSAAGNPTVPVADSGIRSQHTLQGRLFGLMAGFGFDGEVVHRLHARRRGHIDLFSYAGPLLKSLRRYRFPQMDVEVVETGERIRGAWVFLFNLPRYGGGLPVAPEVRGDDGWLDLIVMERGGRFHFLRDFTSILRGLRGRLRDVHHRLVKAVRISAEQPVRVQTDGDPAGFLPATVEVVPAALTLVVP